MENEILKLEDENGKIKEYKILLVFKWFQTGKFYIVYADMNNDLNGEYDIYANIFDPNDLSVFENIETDEEWDMIEQKLEEMRDNNDKS